MFSLILHFCNECKCFFHIYLFMLEYWRSPTLGWTTGREVKAPRARIGGASSTHLNCMLMSSSPLTFSSEIPSPQTNSYHPRRYFTEGRVSVSCEEGDGGEDKRTGVEKARTLSPFSSNKPQTLSQPQTPGITVMCRRRAPAVMVYLVRCGSGKMVNAIFMRPAP